VNAYEWKQEARRQRLQRAADRAKGEGEAKVSSGFRFFHEMNGQPVLVGHHSERRHRNAIRKADNRIRSGFARLKDAEELSRRAASVGSGGISSDDPEAVAKLDDKVETLKAERDRMKQINAHWRKHGTLGGLDLGESDLHRCRENMRIWGGAPFPSYCLTNIAARIREAERRAKELAQLTERAAAGPTEATVNGVAITTDPADNRVTLTFPRRLSREEYKRVRSFGFLWSPTRSGFTRKLTGNGGAESVARMLADTFESAPGSVPSGPYQ
jgi:hypothetical protein